MADDIITKDFRQYLEEKFKGIHDKLDSVSESHKEKFQELEEEQQEIKKGLNWVSTRVWMAIGGLTVITFVGGYLALQFKQLNKSQVAEQIEPIKTDIAVIKNTLKQYDFEIIE